MKYALILLVIICAPVFVSGCATVDAVQGVVAERGSQANDEALQSAEFVICRGISVGAWRRAYASDPVRTRAWAELCADPAVAPVVAPVTP